MRVKSGSCSYSCTLQGVRKAINPQRPRAGRYQALWAKIWRARPWRTRVGTERYWWLKAGLRSITLSARIWPIWRRSNKQGRIASYCNTTASQNCLQRCRKHFRLRWETAHIHLAARMLRLLLQRCQALLHLRRRQLAISKTVFSEICKEQLNHLVTSSDNARTKILTDKSADQTKFQKQSRRSPCLARCRPRDAWQDGNHPCSTSRPKSFQWYLNPSAPWGRASVSNL